MKKLSIIILMLGIFVSCSNSTPFDQNNNLLLKLDPDLPNGAVKIFAQGVICTAMDEWKISFMPKGDELYFTVSGREKIAIVSMKFKNNKWLDPEIASFSGVYDDYAPVISYDGSKLIFVSRRPIKSGADANDNNLWITTRENDTWTEPILLTNDISLQGSREVWPALAPNGDLYFSSNRKNGLGMFDLYVSRFVDGKYQKPENLGSPINSELGEYCPFISPDGNYLIFEIVDKPEGLGQGDMYISLKQSDGSWGEPKNMGETFNSRANDCFPCLSPDKKFFFFMSDRRVRFPKTEKRITYKEIMKDVMKNGGWDIYWIDVESLNVFF